MSPERNPSRSTIFPSLFRKAARLATIVDELIPVRSSNKTQSTTPYEYFLQILLHYNSKGQSCKVEHNGIKCSLFNLVFIVSPPE